MGKLALLVGGPADGRRLTVSDNPPSYMEVEAHTHLADRFVRVLYRRQEVRHPDGSTALWVYSHSSVSDPLLHIISQYRGETPSP